MQEAITPSPVEPVDVLLVEADEGHARRLESELSETRGAMEVGRGLYGVTRVASRADALTALADREFGAVLLDLGLPDSEGQPTLAEVRNAAGRAPLIVLARVDDDGEALAAIQRGAQDHLSLDGLDGRLLRRTIRHAIERKRAEQRLVARASELEVAHNRIQKQADELQSRAEQLDRINHELDDFAYIASHDLKEPLRGIAAYCEILREDYQHRLDEDGRARLGKLVELCGRLENLIGDLLTYCRVGGMRPAETNVDLSAVVADVVKTLQPAIDRRRAGVEITCTLPIVAGDATLIGMAVGNLISNGLKFNDRDHPRVEIGCLATDPPTIYVRDNGIGIDEKHHEDVFAIFRRLHSRSQYDGTGAGLTIVRKIVESLGGRVWLESASGEGSTFYFTLAPPREANAVEPGLCPPHWLGHAHESVARHNPPAG